MPRSLFFIVVAATLAFGVAGALARTVDIAGDWSPERVKTSCEKAGSTNFSEGGGPNSNLYGCDKPCDGSVCSVTCADNKCQGTVPDRSVEPCIFFCRATVPRVLRGERLR